MADAGKTNFLQVFWEFFVIFVLGVLVVPAMWFMAYMYPTWEKWIKENSDLVKKPERLLLIIPFTVLILLAMMIYRGLHKTFETAVKDKFGLKLF